jgi:hypothetical protein
MLTALEEITFRFILSCDNLGISAAADSIFVADELEVFYLIIICLATVPVEISCKQ